jgi:hypothetical protein
MKNLKFLLALVLVATLFSCTENSRVRKWGGDGTLELPKGQKLVNLTWKGDQLWYLTRPMTERDSVETYTFHEESSFGIIEGTYRVIESR